MPREASRWPYVLAVKGTTSAYAADAEPVTRHRRGGPGRPPGAAYPGPPANLRQLAITHADEARPVTWRHGTKVTKGNPAASMTSQFLAIRVRPANRDIPRTPDGSLPDCWLLAEWPPHADEPTDYWLSTLPPGTPVAELIRLAKICWRIEHDYRELKHGLGLDHFEGRRRRSGRTVPPRATAAHSAYITENGGSAHRRRDPRPSRAGRVEDVQVAFDSLPELVFRVAPEAAVLLPPVVIPVGVAHLPQMPERRV